jgi:hypothetical protein
MFRHDCFSRLRAIDCSFFRGLQAPGCITALSSTATLRGVRCPTRTVFCCSCVRPALPAPTCCFCFRWTPLRFPPPPPFFVQAVSKLKTAAND